MILIKKFASGTRYNIMFKISRKMDRDDRVNLKCREFITLWYPSKLKMVFSLMRWIIVVFKS